MNNISVVKNIKQILINIDRLVPDLQEKTNEIHSLLSHYDVEASAPDSLLSLISARKSFVDEILAQQQRLNELLRQKEQSKSAAYAVELSRLKNKITTKLDEIAEQDNLNRKLILQHKILVSQKSSEIRKGKKAINAYNVFPHRKSIFVDIAVQA